MAIAARLERDREVPAWLGLAAAAAALGALVWLERRRPLRRPTQGKVRRELRNLAVAALGAATAGVVARPVIHPLSRLVAERRWGLVQIVRLPVWAEVGVSVLLLDYTSYVWHVLTHRVPFLWRFHLAHHVDLDVDATTGLRFHPGELLLEIPWRALQVLLIGAAPLSLSAWVAITRLALLFHHSNVELPEGLERRLSTVVVTPRVHGIHHSIVEEESRSNWAQLFAWPDFLHGTARFDPPAQDVTTGVPAYRDPEELTLGKLLDLPLHPPRPAWQLPDGATPTRTPSVEPMDLVVE